MTSLQHAPRDPAADDVKLISQLLVHHVKLCARRSLKFGRSYPSKLFLSVNTALPHPLCRWHYTKNNHPINKTPVRHLYPPGVLKPLPITITIKRVTPGQFRLREPPETRCSENPLLRGDSCGVALKRRSRASDRAQPVSLSGLSSGCDRRVTGSQRTGVIARTCSPLR